MMKKRFGKQIALWISDPGPVPEAERSSSMATLTDLLENQKSITGGYLTGKLQIPIPKNRRKAL